jgi:hypothetical protein
MFKVELLPDEIVGRLNWPVAPEGKPVTLRVIVCELPLTVAELMV